MLTEIGMVGSGLRGVAWRTLYRKSMYKSDYIASEADSQLLFNMTNHLLNNSTDRRDIFFDTSY